jgi:hemolysin III
MKELILSIKDPVSCLTHMAAGLFAIAGLILMLFNAGTPEQLISFAIFGGSMVLMYTASTVYHMFSVSDSATRLLRKFDHIMIYYFIAGTFTPFILLLAEGDTRWLLFSLIWGIALLGTFFKLFWLNAPAWLSIGLYLGMGWLGLLVLPYAFSALPASAGSWIIAGGLCYTLGAVIYGLRRPNPVPDWFGFHEIWHLFVMGGSFCHFWVVYRYLAVS